MYISSISISKYLTKVAWKSKGIKFFLATKKEKRLLGISKSSYGGNQFPVFT